MERVILGVLFGGWVLSTAFAEKDEDKAMKTVSSVPEITRAYLLAHGFKESAADPGVFAREHVRLRDVLRDLGFRVSDLSPVPNGQRPNEALTVDARGMHVLVRPEFRDSKRGMGPGMVEQPLDDADLLCAVTVRFPVSERKYLKTDSSPRMRIKSVAVPEDRFKTFAGYI